MELNKIIQQYQQLGPNFEYLGSPSGLYLQYNESGDWSVVHLNWIERIFRWLGCYATGTRLETVAAQLQLEPNVSDALREKITHTWNRVYPNQACPLHPAAGQLAPSFIDQRPSLKELDFTTKTHNPRNEAFPNRLPGNIATDKLHVGGAVISIESGNLFGAQVPCIVNAANEECLGGGGIDGAIHAAAGPGLRTLCEELPIIQGTARCKTGDAVITGSAKLAAQQIHHIIHAVGPRNTNPHRDQLLAQTYQRILAKAEEHQIRSLAIPAISTAIFGCPFGKSTELAIRTVEKYLHEHPGKFDEVKLVFLDQHPDFYNPQTQSNSESTLQTAIKNATNCAWAVHIARHMEHPHATLEKAQEPVESSF